MRNTVWLLALMLMIVNFASCAEEKTEEMDDLTAKIGGTIGGCQVTDMTEGMVVGIFCDIGGNEKQEIAHSSAIPAGTGPWSLMVSEEVDEACQGTLLETGGAKKIPLYFFAYIDEGGDGRDDEPFVGSASPENQGIYFFTQDVPDIGARHGYNVQGTSGVPFNGTFSQVSVYIETFCAEADDDDSGADGDAS